MGQAQIYAYMVKHPNEWIKIEVLKKLFGKSASFCCRKMCDANEMSRRRQNKGGINPPFEYIYNPKKHL
jgi:hypothetical protein